MKGNAVAAIIALVLLTLSANAFASSATRCRVLAIEASINPTGIAAEIAEYSAIFKKTPFNKFKGFKLISSQTIELDSPAPQQLKLPDRIGGTLQMVQKQKRQFQLALTLARPGQKPIAIKGIASPGAPLFAAGMKSADGIWIFGIACDEASKTIKY